MKPLTVRVDTSSPVPPYEQVRLQIADLILGGHLEENDRLPAVRQLAADLGLAAGTIARAYRELESATLVISRTGAGTRVAPRPARSREAQLADAASTYIANGRRVGASDDQLLAAVRIALSSAPSR
ncbi:GntR family transcriptional regulator [Streptomyces sp. AcE210]|uniref:GntR family transcriptional regulator n=1 Tax=Streptomyces sp. AcE210 TaxID=2292703 RepID=UPI000E30875F|nr:GntR family transcriptional regulator [Streptomyces sp. AcE210]RFC78130.1 GntR family transcriptional regulator [Streptomyces sp. AcE210]